MDPERQPLLCPASDYVRVRSRRALTYEEVLLSRTAAGWRRARCLLAMLFWSVLATFLSMLACILLAAPRCREPAMPSVQPTHLSFAPLGLR